MTEAGKHAWLGVSERELAHAIRTTVAAVASLFIARLLRMPESYWASISTLIVMQSTLGAAWTMSKQRLAGAALGASTGALLVMYAGGNVIAYALGLLTLGVLCAALQIERNAYRYAGVTLAIVMLVARTEPVWRIALHRFVEISLGIAVGLAITALWPEAATAP